MCVYMYIVNAKFLLTKVYVILLLEIMEICFKDEKNSKCCKWLEDKIGKQYIRYFIYLIYCH